LEEGDHRRENKLAKKGVIGAGGGFGQTQLGDKNSRGQTWSTSDPLDQGEAYGQETGPLALVKEKTLGQSPAQENQKMAVRGVKLCQT